MKIRTLISVGVLTAVLAGCGSDGVKLSPTVVDNSGGNGGGGSNSGDANVCASYVRNGSTVAGAFEGGNCYYNSAFVGTNNPLTTEYMFVPELPNGGVHIFEDSLFVGKNVSSGVAPAEGEGATLEVAPGALIAFSNPDEYLRVTRGSQIFAEGTKDKPIIFSAVKDLIDGSATQNDRGLWGGILINGNGITNKCTDAERTSNTCHIAAEGQPSHYGGNDNSESSGSLKYVQIRHAGFEVVEGDELNALTLNAVGSGTTIEYVQTYTSLDDGFEMFGGAVNLKNIVAVNVGDDSIDFSEGWQGNIQFALVVHTSGGNRCIEADNNGSNNNVEPFTKGRVSNLTCITSDVATGTGVYPNATSKGDSEGLVFREGTDFELYNSIITSNDPVMASNECFEVESARSGQSITNGWSAARSNIIACGEPLKVDSDTGLALADLENWLENVMTDNIIVDAASLPATVIEGLNAHDPANPTVTAYLTDASGLASSIPAYDVTQLADTFSPNAAPAEGAAGSSSFFEAVDFIGAVKPGSDWVAGWTKLD